MLALLVLFFFFSFTLPTLFSSTPASTHFFSLFFFLLVTHLSNSNFLFQDNWVFDKNSTLFLTLENGFLLHHFLFKFELMMATILRTESTIVKFTPEEKLFKDYKETNE